MPQDKDFKRLVRQRMTETGERYTVARTKLSTQNRPRRRGDVEGWIELLARPGVPGRPNEGFERLQALPEDELRRACLRALTHGSWRVRRRCAQLLDDLTLTDETIAALTASLRDEHPGVRGAALHSLVCVHCKPDACTIDVRSIALSMLGDPFAQVRRQAVGALHQYHAPDPSFDDEETIDLLRRVAVNDISALVRREAAALVREKERRAAGEASRRELPDDLRRKTERHPGKWVAIADGRIISAQPFLGRLRRDMKGTGHPEALVVWVDPLVSVS